MTKVIKGEFEKIKDVKVEDVSLTCDTPLEVFNNEVNRLSGIDDDSEHEADDDMGYDPSDVAFTKWLELKFFNYKTMDHYTIKALWIYWIREDVEDNEWYEALEDSELKDEALRNKAIMEGLIKEDDDDESCYEQMRRWNINANYNDAYETNHENNEKEELWYNNDEEYVAVRKYEYDDPTITREEACRAYQEIFRKMDEGWMVTRAE
ncbi:hypothetical protein Tco_1095184 [Tanacetum coccineum]